MVNVSIRVKDNNKFGEEIGFNASFSDTCKLIEVKKWIDRMVGDENELVSTSIEEI